MNFRLFPAYFDRPERMGFADQEEGEILELFLRQHWFKNVPWLLVSVVLFFAPFFTIYFSSSFGLTISMPFNVGVSLMILWYMLVTAYVLEQFLHWYFNIYIVTNTHIVDINLVSLLSRNVSEGRLDDIQDVTTHLTGIFGSLFNFGDVLIKTAAQGAVLSFASVPYPDRVAERIQDLQAVQEGGNTDVS